MTEQESMEIIMQVAYDGEFSNNSNEAFGIACKCIERQIPKDIFHYDWNGIDGVPYDLCPNCKNNLCTNGLFSRSKKYINYCSNCGQALKWENKE